MLVVSVCSKCGIEQPETEFHKSSSHNTGRNPQCRTCFNATRRNQSGKALEAKQKREREYYGSNKEQVRERQLMRKYGLIVEDYNRMVAEQDNKCAICSTEMTGPREPAVDHDHVTGEVRDLLCSKCNAGIGLLQDSPDVLLKAAKYLEKHRR